MTSRLATRLGVVGAFMAGVVALAASLNAGVEEDGGTLALGDAVGCSSGLAADDEHVPNVDAPLPPPVEPAPADIVPF